MVIKIATKVNTLIDVINANGLVDNDYLLVHVLGPAITTIVKTALNNATVINVHID